MGSVLDELGDYLGSANNRAQLWDALLEHLYLALLPLLLGVLAAVAAGWLGIRFRPARKALLVGANVLYTIPSLALFVVIPGIIGTKILNSVNVVLALTLYTAALLVRPVLDALDAVPSPVVAAATAMGYRPARRFLGVELPLAVPVLTAGVRVASVSNISLVSVGALIGIGGLGVLFTDGFQREYFAPIVVGIVLTLVLALVMDVLLVLLRRLLTPWQRPAPVTGGAA
ncbi:osmoprotectant transport system permease protein [Amycolatopsis arida]|uniref:Osmoprotectant transport system permease protein n=1 Tax=Amycolatopsis arida TaxID=587909 RepID=A0A1I5PGN7_9PSEU|nr:ABC transporter permease subunit [Amycolatopsis arida]TDX98488.1 osmoprotectant transport system permease protein [Amycolatopsis arida]SFP33017.1 osmoprotectant transport system permease protein [Amycolatopsis arida]